MIAQKSLNENEILKIRDTLNKIYGEGLTVEIEDHSQEKLNFLEFWVAAAKGSILTWNYSKNYDIVYQTRPKQVVRFPDIRAYYQPSIFRSICYGMIIKAVRASPHPLGQLIGITQLAIELKVKGYRLRWITEAIYKTDTKFRHELKKTLRYFWNFIPNHSRTFLVRNQREKPITRFSR